MQISKDVYEVDDGTPNQIGQIDQQEEYDTDAAIEANENAQTNQEALEADAGADSKAAEVAANDT